MSKAGFGLNVVENGSSLVSVSKLCGFLGLGQEPMKKIVFSMGSRSQLGMVQLP